MNFDRFTRTPNFELCGWLEYLNIYANPSKFYILSQGFSDIEMKQGFIVGVYLLYWYGVSFTGVQEGLIERAEGYDTIKTQTYTTPV